MVPGPHPPSNKRTADGDLRADTAKSHRIHDAAAVADTATAPATGPSPAADAAPGLGGSSAAEATEATEATEAVSMKELVAAIKAEMGVAGDVSMKEDIARAVEDLGIGEECDELTRLKDKMNRVAEELNLNKRAR